MKIQTRTAAAWVAAISLGMAAMASQAADPQTAKPKTESAAQGQGASEGTKDAKDSKNFCGMVGKEYVCIP